MEIQKLKVTIMLLVFLTLLSCLGLFAALQSGILPRIVLASSGFSGFALLLCVVFWHNRKRLLGQEGSHGPNK